MRELVHVLRGLRRSPAYTVTVVVTLALGIGANTAIFSMIHGVLLEPLPYRDGDELVVLRQQIGDDSPVPVSIAEFFDYRARSKSVDLVEYHTMSFTLLGRSEPDRVTTGVVSHDFFDVLGVAPMHGRSFVADDEAHGAEAVLLISQPFFERAFGGDPAVVGQVFEMNNRPHTVIGVLPPIPQFPNENDVYMPTSACPFRANGERQMHENRGAFRALTVLGRLRPDNDVARARADVDEMWRRFAADHADTYSQAPDFAAEAVPLSQELTRRARPMLLVLLATTALVLVLACANVANLMLARLVARRRELAVRAALGAGRWRLTYPTALESLVLATIGGVCGIAMAAGGLGLLRDFTALLSPRAATVDLDPAVLAFGLGLALVTGLLFGVVPALSRRLDLVSAFRDGDHATAGGRSRLKTALVVLQVAVSTVLLVGAGLLLRSFERLDRVDPGFNPDRVLTAQVALNWSKYTSAQQSRAFFEQVLDRLAGHPAIVSAAVGSVAPLTQQGGNGQTIQVEGQPVEDGQPQPILDLHFVSADYFQTLEVGLVRGRVFDSRDHDQAMPVAVVNATTARRYWPNQDPIGRRISLDGGDSWVEVIGVVNDVRNYQLDRSGAEELYRPFSQTGFANRIVVRTRADPSAVSRDVRQAVFAVDPEQPVDRVETLEALRHASMATPRTTTWLLALFAGLALAITIAGVAGLIAWSVGQRVREIGVRMALGARRRDVLVLIIRQGLTLLSVGLVVGLGCAVFFTRMLADLLFETERLDPVTLAVVAATLLGVGVVACLPPALRAMAIDPQRAVRAS